MGYEPKYKPKNKFKIECPLRFNTSESEIKYIGKNCAWWLPIQRACSVQVLARGNAFPKGE